MAPHSSILAWRIPRTEEPGGLQPLESQRVSNSANPCLQETLSTTGEFWFSLLWGHCSFALDLGVGKVLFVPSKTFPQSYGIL